MNFVAVQFAHLGAQLSQVRVTNLQGRVTTKKKLGFTGSLVIRSERAIIHAL